MWLTKLPHIIVRTLVACSLFAPFLSGAMQSSWIELSPLTIEETLIDASGEDGAEQFDFPGLLPSLVDVESRLAGLADSVLYIAPATAGCACSASNPPTGPPLIVISFAVSTVFDI